MKADNLEKLIRDAARSDQRIGPLEESLKWGQRSFAPKKRNTGSSVRIQENPDGTHSLMFICHAHLVDRFRERYPTELRYDGNRGIIVDGEGPFDEDAARDCIAMALTYKLDR